jgi:hypothetical protein
MEAEGTLPEDTLESLNKLRLATKGESESIAALTMSEAPATFEEALAIWIRVVEPE